MNSPHLHNGEFHTEELPDDVWIALMRWTAGKRDELAEVLAPFGMTTQELSVPYYYRVCLKDHDDSPTG